MVNTRKPPTVASAPTPPETLLLGTPQAADEALGTGNAASEFLARPRPPGRETIRIRREQCAEEVTGICWRAVVVDGLGWPGPVASWHHLELTVDPQCSPPVSCRLDGAPVELEQHLDGVWRPRRTENDG